MKRLFRAATLFVLTAAAALCAPVSWTLSNAAFADGGALSGTFFFDADTGAVTNWNLAATAGTVLTAFTYIPTNSTVHYVAAGDSTCAGPCIEFTTNQQFSVPPGNQYRLLDLSFVALLTDTGGTVSLNLNNAKATASHECLTCSVDRLFTQGTVSTGTPQTITFAALSNVQFGIQPFTIGATASSALPVTLTSTTSSVCFVSGTTVYIVSAGTCSIAATQPGNATFAPATSITQTFTVAPPPVSQTIAFDAIPNQILGLSPLLLAAQSDFLLPVGFASATPAVCKNSDDFVMLLSAGTCTINATQAGNPRYNAATPVMQSFTVSRANAAGTLAAAAAGPFVVGSGPFSAAIGDFNGDGIPDIATANYTSNNVTVLLGNGTGGFTLAPGSPFTVAASPASMAVGDFNADGIQDLATANYGGNSVTVLLGNGSGGFTQPAGSPFTAGTNPVFLAVGDFNGDGIQDLATANFNGNNVTVLVGNGSGAFTAAPGSPFAAGTGPRSLAVGDFNGDGNPDLAITNQTGNNLTVLLGNGSGGFTAATASPFTVGTGPSSVVVGDFNGDGIPDLATANYSGTVSVLLGTGTGGFTAPAGSPFAVGLGPNSVAVGDFNGDGIPDLATANYSGNSITLLLGTGSGAFTAAAGSPFAVGTAPDYLVAADFNGDGIPDLAVTDFSANNVTVLLGSPIAATSVLSAPSLTITGSASLQLTLTVSAGTAFNSLTGTATFRDGTTVLGTATQTGSPYTFTLSGLTPGSHMLTATYGGGAGFSASTSNSLTIQVNPGAPQTITFGALSSVVLGVAPITVNPTDTSDLPVTITSNSTSICIVSGSATVTPIAAGTCSLTASQAGNGVYAIATPVTQTFAVDAAPAIATTSLANGVLNKPYGPYALVAAGGNGIYSWSVTGFLAGLTLTNTGSLGGTPTTAGSFSVTISLSSGGVIVKSTLALTIVTTASPLQIPGGGNGSQVTLTGGAAATAYSQPLLASGGNPPYTWSILGGALPPGLSLSTSGILSGTPTQPGTAEFTSHVTDNSGASATSIFALSIVPQPLTITAGLLQNAPLPNGIAGSDYPAQIMTATGGYPPYTFQLTGALPGGLTLLGGEISGIPTAAATSSFTVTATDSTQATNSAQFQITIEAAHSDLILSQTSLTFQFAAGATGLPPGTNISVRSSVASQLLNYSVSAVPAASWLDLTAGAAAPGAIGINLDPSALSLGAGVQKTAVVVTCIAPSTCAGNSQSIDVSLTVASAPPQLAVSTTLLSFSAQTPNAQPVSQMLGLQNVGGGTITVNSVTAASSFVTISGTPVSIASGPAVPLMVTVNPAGRASGYYQSTISVNTSAGSVNVPVTLFLSPNPSMTLNPGGLQFQTLAGSSPGNSAGSFLVSVSGSSTVSWTATVPPGASWLTLNTSGGTSTYSNPGAVSFSINPSVAASLAAQSYYAEIQIASNGVVESPLTFLVVLNVSPAASPALPNPAPAGLLFMSASPQTVQVFTGSATPVTWQAASDSPWLLVSPATGSASTSSPGSSSVSVNLTGLAAGVYRGSVSYAMSAAAVRTVSVTLIVGKILAPGTACVPTQLVPSWAATGSLNNFAQPAAAPAPLALLLVDNCGNPVPNGQVEVTFTNGDPALALASTDTTSGNYSGTWTPRSASQNVVITATATAPSQLPSAPLVLQGEVTPNAAPLLMPNGAVNAFTYAAPVAPGTIVAIFGSNLATQTTQATTIPLPVALAQTSVKIAATPTPITLPLFFVSPGQINAQVPFNLTAGEYQIYAVVNGIPTTPIPIQVTADAPGIGQLPSGQIIAQHLIGSAMVTEASPAKPGEIVIFYLAGMGLTNPAVASGAASPSASPAVPLDTPTITLNGVPVPAADILFAGLTPTLVGLYQIDLQVPATAANGDLPLVLTQSTGLSATTILPVHN